MKQFLRFQSGASFIIWFFLFHYCTSKHIDLATLFYTQKNEDIGKTLVAFAAILLFVSIPIGVLIQQITVSLLSPFYAYTQSISKYFDNIYHCKKGYNWTNRATIWLRKAVSVKKVEKNSCENCKKSGISYESTVTFAQLQEEVTNIVSYYSARINNALIAPALAFIASGLINNNIFCDNTTLISIWMAILIVLLIYIPLMVREIVEVETMIDVIWGMESCLKYEIAENQFTEHMKSKWECEVYNKKTVEEVSCG